MLVLSLITLLVASVSTFLSLNTQEDVFKAAMGCSAVISLLLTLFFAPWVLKLAIIAIPLVIDKFNDLSTERSLN